MMAVIREGEGASAGNFEAAGTGSKAVLRVCAVPPPTMNWEVFGCFGELQKGFS